jgi:hypothetical protein
VRGREREREREKEKEKEGGSWKAPIGGPMSRRLPYGK